MLQLRHPVKWYEFAEVISDGLVIIKGWKQPMVSIPLSYKLDHLLIRAVMTMRFLYFNTKPVFPQNLGKKRWKWPVLYFMVPVGPDLLAPVKICCKCLIFDAPAGVRQFIFPQGHMRNLQRDTTKQNWVQLSLQQSLLVPCISHGCLAIKTCCILSSDAFSLNLQE